MDDLLRVRGRQRLRDLPDDDVDRSAVQGRPCKSSRSVGPSHVLHGDEHVAPLMPKSCSLTTCGLSIDATANTSRRKRSTTSASPRDRL